MSQGLERTSDSAFTGIGRWCGGGLCIEIGDVGMYLQVYLILIYLLSYLFPLEGKQKTTKNCWRS